MLLTLLRRMLKTVQQLLGHTEIQTTMRYVKFSPEHAAKAAEPSRSATLSVRSPIADECE